MKKPCWQIIAVQNAAIFAFAAVIIPALLASRRSVVEGLRKVV